MKKNEKIKNNIPITRNNVLIYFDKNILLKIKTETLSDGVFNRLTKDERELLKC